MDDQELIRSKLSNLQSEIAPLSDAELARRKDALRIQDLQACVEFKRYIWSLLVMILLFSMALHGSFAIVNIVSSLLPFGSPLGIAGSFTALGGAAFVLFAVIDSLYARRYIGCNGLELSQRERESIEARTNAFFVPGCVYDCRMIQNRIDVNTMRYYIPMVVAVLLTNIWVNDPASSAPDLGTPEGVRYACSHWISMMIQLMIVVCIVMNLYSLRRRRPHIETLHIDVWFEVRRRWDDASDLHGMILQ